MLLVTFNTFFKVSLLKIVIGNIGCNYIFDREGKLENSDATSSDAVN